MLYWLTAHDARVASLGGSAQCLRHWPTANIISLAGCEIGCDYRVFNPRHPPTTKHKARFLRALFLPVRESLLQS